jgi:hypothetical protein
MMQFDDVQLDIDVSDELMALDINAVRIRSLPAVEQPNKYNRQFIIKNGKRID